MAEMGRPSIWKEPADLILAVENYFTWVKGEFEEQEVSVTGKDGITVTGKQMVCTRAPEPITITGLALFLGFESRQSIYDYEKDSEFSYIIKNARLRVEHAYEKQLYSDKPTGSIFALKNMGWKDKTETELTGKDGGPVQNVIQLKIIRDKGNTATLSDTASESTEGTGSEEKV